MSVKETAGADPRWRHCRRRGDRIRAGAAAVVREWGRVLHSLRWDPPSRSGARLAPGPGPEPRVYSVCVCASFVSFLFLLLLLHETVFSSWLRLCCFWGLLGYRSMAIIDGFAMSLFFIRFYFCTGR